MRSIFLGFICQQKFALLFLAAVMGFVYFNFQQTHPASVTMTIDGQQVESKVLSYGPTCKASAKISPIPDNWESPIREFKR